MRDGIKVTLCAPGESGDDRHFWKNTGQTSRLKTHCPQGHPYSGDNLYQYGKFRHCRKCRNAKRRSKVDARRVSK